MKKIIKQFTAVAVIATLLLTTGCKKDTPFDTSNSAFVTQDGAVMATNADSISVDFGLNTLHVKIAIINGAPIKAGYLELYFVNINGPDFLVNAANAGLPFSAGSSDLFGMNYSNNFVNADGSQSQKSFKQFSISSATKGSIKITKNDLVARRIEGTVTDCVLYDNNATQNDAAPKNATTITCSFWISY